MVRLRIRKARHCNIAVANGLNDAMKMSLASIPKQKYLVANMTYLDFEDASSFCNAIKALVQRLQQREYLCRFSL